MSGVHRPLTSSSDTGLLRLSPESVTIADLRPGTTGAVEVAVTNTSDAAALVSVVGDLYSSQLAGEHDLLQVTLAGCTQPWAGVPATPVAALSAPVCRTGEVPASSGSLAAVPLEAGQTLHLLISAGLGEQAGNGAQGQTWTATFDVLTQTSAPPALPLALTGADLSPVATAACALFVAGAFAVRVRSRRTRKDTAR